MRNIVKEACVERLDEAILAEKNGANRIELCSRLDLDGLTPHRNMIKDVINSVKIPVKVMIRPRAGNFVYHDQELDVMKDILWKAWKLTPSKLNFMPYNVFVLDSSKKEYKQ